MNKGKDKIKTWDRMISKLKDNFLPTDYIINLFRKLQNPRKKELIVQ